MHAFHHGKNFDMAGNTPNSSIRVILSILLTCAGAVGAASGALVRKYPYLLSCCNWCAKRNNTKNYDLIDNSNIDIEEGQKAPSTFSLKEVNKRKLSKAGGGTVKIGVHTPGTIFIDEKMNVHGSGLVYADTEIEQDKTYFEIRVCEPGSLFVGVGSLPNPDAVQHPDQVLHSKTCWMAPFGGDDGPAVEQDDIISCTYDQSDVPTRLYYYINGAALPAATISGIRGKVWPGIFISDGAKVEVNFDARKCSHYDVAAPRGFLPLIPSRDII